MAEAPAPPLFLPMRLLCADDEMGAEVYLAAYDQDQAGIGFEIARELRRLHPDVYPGPKEELMFALFPPVTSDLLTFYLRDLLSRTPEGAWPRVYWQDEDVASIQRYVEYLQDPDLDTFPARLAIADAVINPLIEALFLGAVVSICSSVVLVKVASTAVVANMLGCTYDQVVNAVSQAWVDGQALRTYRHAPNTGSRKSWAAGDATSRAVRQMVVGQGAKVVLVGAIVGVAAALAEAHRVVRPGGELRFYEHVLARDPGMARFQRFADRMDDVLLAGAVIRATNAEVRRLAGGLQRTLGTETVPGSVKDAPSTACAS